jgi:drug/metabolite transporter (DMT)-like permease
MLSGIIWALMAGLMWGLIFVGPMLAPDYPAVLLSTGRYLALGMIALPLAWLGRRRLRQLSRRDWLTALRISTIGNLVYYLFLAAAIQRTGSPVSTIIVGALPVVLPICANLLYSQRDGHLSWRRLLMSLAVVAVGLVLVNIAELRHGLPNFSPLRYGAGLGMALLAMICWAVYALQNARWLRENPNKSPMMWATAQGLAILPLSLIGYLGSCLWLAWQEPDFPLPFGPQPGQFIALMFVIAILCSWIGALCWNEASQRLPTAILGPLIVFENLAGLLYAFVLRHSWPPLATLFGIAALIVGVVMAVRARPAPTVVSANVKE